MPSARAPESSPESSAHARPPQSSQNGAPEPEPEPDPTGQSPDAPIRFTSDDDVARGNEERANAEPEPAALHAAEVPGKPDVAAQRREIAKQHDD
ncbi:MAG: hypothetical protein M3680_30960 [Myxococcota bacterium]|nr:hypothetical protein [Myxococcota bacterium]